eukprot:6415672-Amphidinium_carterae.1
MRVWRDQLRAPDGLLILGHSEGHHPNTIDAFDIYGSSLTSYSRCHTGRHVNHHPISTGRGSN